MSPMPFASRAASALLLVLLAACNGGSGSKGPATPPTSAPTLGPGTTVTVTFLGPLPNAAAVSTASGIFVPTTLSASKLSFLVPAGTNNYAFAIACPAVNVTGTLLAEYVFEANLSDGASYSVSPCVAAAGATGPAVGTFDISAIPGAVTARIMGAQGFSGDINGVTGSFSVSMPTGANDIAVMALDGFGNILAVKMLRSQIVPGPVNAGATIVVGAADQIMNEPVTITGAPAGFGAGALNAEYFTSNGTRFSLNNGSQFQYSALSFANLSTLDQYHISTTTTNASINETLGMTLYSSTGTAVTLTYPAPWTYTPPAPAQFPTFSFSYTGFAGLATQTYSGTISWQPAISNPVSVITTYATAASLGTQTSVTIPNLTALPGFFGSAAPGVAVNWTQQIDGGTFPSYVFPAPVPGSLSFVAASGTYIEP